MGAPPAQGGGHCGKHLCNNSRSALQLRLFLTFRTRGGGAPGRRTPADHRGPPPHPVSDHIPSVICYFGRSLHPLCVPTAGMATACPQPAIPFPSFARGGGTFRTFHLSLYTFHFSLSTFTFFTYSTFYLMVAEIACHFPPLTLNFPLFTFHCSLFTGS